MKNIGSDDKSIKLIYLFGSTLKKSLSDASDIDLAFLIDDAHYENILFKRHILHIMLLHR